MSAAILAQGRLRRVFFYAILVMFPLAIVCGLEVLAQAVHLADIVAPLADTSVFKNRARFPGYFRSDIRSITHERDGLRLYRPWQGDGVTINALGLRTAPPTPKKPGEWRIAVTGGSTAWGYGVLDADTIAVQLEGIFRDQGHGNVSVYNFGIGGRELRHELDLLRKFRDIYAIDQVIFYTGGNDVTYSYMRQLNPGGSDNFQLDTWELIKTAQRLHDQIFSTSKETLDQLDAVILPKLREQAQLSVSIRAAEDYCNRSGLICDFVLQPMLATRRMASGKERDMQKALLRLYPGLDAAAVVMYAGAAAQRSDNAVHDFSSVLDRAGDHFYADAVHISEAGNRIIAEQLAATIGVRTK